MSAQGKPIKVLMAKTSLDGHWRGIAVVSTALRDAGMEVVYGGMLTAEEIASAAIQEDVDVIGLNIGGRYGSVSRLMETLRQQREDVLVVAGGTIPPEDIPVLKELGIAEVFPPGSSLDSIVEFIHKALTRSP